MPKEDIEMFTPTNLANATPGSLTDELGWTRKQKKRLEKTEGFLKTALKSRLEDEHNVEGEEYGATITPQRRSGLDQKRIRADMGETWCEKYTTITEFDVVRTYPLDK